LFRVGQQKREKEKQFEKKVEFAGRSYDKKQAMVFKNHEKTMVLTCILKKCKLLCFHGFEKPWCYETMVFQGHMMKIPRFFGNPWSRKTMVF
jgi:hypothetical protein